MFPITPIQNLLSFSAKRTNACRRRCTCVGRKCTCWSDVVKGPRLAGKSLWKLGSGLSGAGKYRTTTRVRSPLARQEGSRPRSIRYTIWRWCKGRSYSSFGVLPHIGETLTASRDQTNRYGVDLACQLNYFEAILYSPVHLNCSFISQKVLLRWFQPATIEYDPHPHFIP